MGFAQLAVFTILSGAVLYGFSVYNEHDLAARDQIQDAERLADDRSVVHRQAAITVESDSWNNGQDELTLTMRNSGSVTLRLDDVDVIVDGVYRTDDITVKEVEGTTSDVWPPETTLVLTITMTGAYSGPDSPTDAVVITDEGVKAFWRD